MRARMALTVTALAVALPAQLAVTDVGLTMLSGSSTGTASPVAGQACGPVVCAPFLAAPMAAGQSRVVRHHAPVNTPFALAIGLAGPCLQIPGIANDLMLQLPPVTLAVGVTAPLSLSAACPQGTANFTLTLPAGAPSGVTFRLQSVGVSRTGQLACSPSIEVVSR